MTRRSAPAHHRSTMTFRPVSLVVLLAAVLLVAVYSLFVDTTTTQGQTNGKSWRLPKKLREASGLAVIDDKHLLTMTDEKAIVYSFDLDTTVVKRWLTIGPPVKGDFEGIAVKNGVVYLITSDGKLYHAPGDAKPVDTGLGKVCEIEGLDAVGDDLLILCKTNYREEDKGMILIFSWSLKTGLLSPHLRYSVAGLSDVHKLHPSALAFVDGRYLILAAREKRMVIINTDGTAMVKRLKGHRQAEGIAVLSDGRVVITDEGKHEGGLVTVYPSIRDID